MAPEVCVRVCVRVRESTGNPTGAQTVYFHLIPGGCCCCSENPFSVDAGMRWSTARRWTRPRCRWKPPAGSGLSPRRQRAGPSTRRFARQMSSHFRRINVGGIDPTWCSPALIRRRSKPSRDESVAPALRLRSRHVYVISCANPCLLIAVRPTAPTNDLITGLSGRKQLFVSDRLQR